MLNLVWIPTVLMCLGEGHLFGPKKEYVIKHDNKVTYFKTVCPYGDLRLVTEDIPNGIFYVKEFPNETKNKNLSK
ncbi:MAG: hypothetical protein COB41_00535 [Proteobacteria bacterium]|nr:MAG: hypothetical protein COB41_00535 [Pseudomonadota bacterium]